MSAVSPPSQELAQKFGVETAMVYVKPNAEQLAEITQLIESGQLKTRIEAVFPLSEAQRAIELSEAGRTRGKIILHP